MSLALRGGGLGALVAVVGMWLGGPLGMGVAWTDGGDRDLMPPMGPSCLSCGMPNTEIWDLADGRVEILVKREVDGWNVKSL